VAGNLLNGPETYKENSPELPDSAPIPLRSIKVVSSHEAFIDDARSLITTEMENMVLNGLSTLVRLLFCVVVFQLPLYFLESNSPRIVSPNGL
jgi:hypothetical protein